MSSSIVAAIDYSDVTEQVLETASDLAEAYELPLVLVYVAPEQPDALFQDNDDETIDDGDEEEMALDEPPPSPEYEQLDALAAPIRARAIQVETYVLAGPFADRILEEAHRHDARMVVLGSHGHGSLYHLLVGSVSEAVIRGAECPVVVVPSGGDS